MPEFIDAIWSLQADIIVVLYNFALPRNDFHHWIFLWVQVTVQNSFSDEMFESKWHYAKEIINRETVTGTTTGFSNYDFRETDDRTRVGSTVRLVSVALRNKIFKMTFLFF